MSDKLFEIKRKFHTDEIDWKLCAGLHEPCALAWLVAEVERHRLEYAALLQIHRKEVEKWVQRTAKLGDQITLMEKQLNCTAGGGMHVNTKCPECA